MNSADEIFPNIRKSVVDLIEDEEGGVPAGRLLMLGAMAVVLSALFVIKAIRVMLATLRIQIRLPIPIRHIAAKAT